VEVKTGGSCSTTGWRDRWKGRRSWRLYGPRFLRHCRATAITGMKTLVAQGRLVAERRVASLRVVLMRVIRDHHA
jgi:hypothetical protein